MVKNLKLEFYLENIYSQIIYNRIILNHILNQSLNFKIHIFLANTYLNLKSIQFHKKRYIFYSIFIEHRLRNSLIECIFYHNVFMIVNSRLIYRRWKKISAR